MCVRGCWSTTCTRRETAATALQRSGGVFAPKADPSPLPGPGAARCVWCLQGMSETFSTLHGLVNKGVNVVMDIPYELWNETSAEVADLKKQVLSPGWKRETLRVELLNEPSVCVCQCDVLVEQYEEVIEDWYKGSQEEDLTTYLCEKHVLKGQDAGKAAAAEAALQLNSDVWFHDCSSLFVFPFSLLERELGSKEEERRPGSHRRGQEEEEKEEGGEEGKGKECRGREWRR